MRESREGSQEELRRSIDNDEVNLLEYARVVWRHRWLITSVCVVVTAATFAFTIRLPKIYESTISFVAPREGGGGGFIGTLAGAGLLQQFAAPSIPSFAPNRDVLVSVLKSRTVAQAVVERFRLQERYGSRYLEDAIKALRTATTVSISKEGVISVTFEDPDPRFAADVANYYAEQLDRLVAQYGLGEAGRQRNFLTGQLARAKADLDGGEEALRRFQEQNRAIVLQEQTKGAIEAAARLKGEILAAEVQRQVLRNFATDANPEVIALQLRIDEMNRQLAQMQYGDGASRELGHRRERRDFSVPFAQVPGVGLELTRLTRDVKVQETLVLLLTQQLEQTKIAEAKDLPIVQVLDRAVPAERHAKPRLRLRLGVAALASFAGSVVIAAMLDSFQRRRKRATR